MDEEESQQKSAHQLVYFAAERTLMAWVRTALSLMALGFVIDRFGLVMRQVLPDTGHALHSRAFSFWGGTTLVLFGTAMAAVAAVRYLRLALAFRREEGIRTGHGIFVGVLFTAIVALSGLVIAFFLLAVTD